jgi:hypothetical protein
LGHFVGSTAVQRFAELLNGYRWEHGEALQRASAFFVAAAKVRR